ncbi:MAG: hypothetical protein QM638_17980 [Nocardioides sp.]|uniref:hypothetical protein n=1 Tax=Nocardioides sp. TaxID=35761 RepID=UPI0039E25F2C
MPLTLCVMLWPRPGQDEALSAYEDGVLALLGDHGARLVSRVRRVDGSAGPVEVQVIELPDEAALDSYLADPRRTANAAVRDAVIDRTEIMRVRSVETS